MFLCRLVAVLVAVAVAATGQPTQLRGTGEHDETGMDRDSVARRDPSTAVSAACAEVKSASEPDRLRAAVDGLLLTLNVSVPAEFREVMEATDSPGFVAALRQGAELRCETQAAWAEEEGTSTAAMSSSALVAEDAMMAGAIEAGKLAVGVVASLVKGILTSLDQAQKEIAQWRSKVEELAEMKLEKFTAKVAQATVTVASVQSRARSLYSNMKDLLDLMIDDLAGSLKQDCYKLSAGARPGCTHAQEESIRGARAVMSVALEGAVAELKELIPQAKQAATEFSEIKALSQYYEQTIRDRIDDKDSWLSNYKKDIRAKVYGGCAACVVFPPSCIPCYATAAAILETKINALEEGLQQAKDAMRRVAGYFLNLADLSGRMSNQSQAQHDNMVHVKGKMEQVGRIIKKELVVIWRRYAVKGLTQLRDLLQEKLREA